MNEYKSALDNFKVVYVHSDNGTHTAIYVNGILIDSGNADIRFQRACINLTKVLSALGINYWDYQISNDVAVDRENPSLWKPYQKLSDLYALDRMYRIDENIDIKNIHQKYIKFIKVK